MTQSSSLVSAAPAVVRREITVKATPAHTFDFFTGHMVKWWPDTHHIAVSPFTEIVTEPIAGGRWFERAANGDECDWGRVLDWEPPSRVAWSWHLNPQWQFDPDPEHASRVEIRLEAVDEHTTRVLLEHSGIERHGEGFEALLVGVSSPSGWSEVLELFSKGMEIA